MCKRLNYFRCADGLLKPDLKRIKIFYGAQIKNNRSQQIIIISNSDALIHSYVGLHFYSPAHLPVYTGYRPDTECHKSHEIKTRRRIDGDLYRLCNTHVVCTATRQKNSSCTMYRPTELCCPAQLYVGWRFWPIA